MKVISSLVSIIILFTFIFIFFCFVLFIRFIGNSHLLLKWSGRNKKRLRGLNSDYDEDEPISALESFDSFCKVVDLGEKKRKLENGEVDRKEKEGKGLNLNSLRNGDNSAGGRSRDINGVSKSENSSSSSSSSNSGDNDSSDDDSNNDSDADSNRNKNDHISREYEDDDEEEDEEEETGGVENERISVLPRYQSDHITVAASRPTKIDYSFIGDTASAIGSRGVDGIAVRQPSIVRDLWAQVLSFFFLFELNSLFLSSVIK